MSDDISDLIRELAVEHGVALDRGDPILVLQTATRRIVQNIFAQAQTAQATALQQHRAELELVSAQWRQDSKQAASSLLHEVQAAIRKSLERELTEQSRSAIAPLQHALARHDKLLARASLVCALSAALVVLAVGALVWTTQQRTEPPARRTDQALSALHGQPGATPCS